MPSLTVSVPHSLTPEEATTRLKGLTARLRARHADKIDDVDEWWGQNRGDFSITLSGVKVKGDADVLDDTVRMRMDLPLIAMAFKSSIESAIRTEVQACLK